LLLRPLNCAAPWLYARRKSFKWKVWSGSHQRRRQTFLFVAHIAAAGEHQHRRRATFGAKCLHTSTPSMPGKSQSRITMSYSRERSMSSASSPSMHSIESMLFMREPQNHSIAKIKVIFDNQNSCHLAYPCPLSAHYIRRFARQKVVQGLKVLDRRCCGLDRLSRPQGMEMLNMPAALAAVKPVIVSSTTRHLVGSTPSLLAASK